MSENDTKITFVISAGDETGQSLMAAAIVMTGIHFKVWGHVSAGLGERIRECSRTAFDRQHRLEELQFFADLVAEGYQDTLTQMLHKDEVELTPETEKDPGDDV